MPRIAIVAALEREVLPLVKSWRRTWRPWEGREFEFLESERAVVVCGGIGPGAARRACEAVIATYRPELVISVGFAGALRAERRVGEVMRPAVVVDESDGSRVGVPGGSGVLITTREVASVARKQELARAYEADLVDMEAAAVWKAAEARQVKFMAVKAVSDEVEFEVPVAPRGVDAQGQFHSGWFVWYMMLRPWLWSRVMRLARSSGVAARRLSEELERVIGERSRSV